MRLCLLFFFFKQKTAYEMRISDWSSDVCSSDLLRGTANGAATPMDGQYLKDFDFEADDGRGEIDMTPDLADAMTFPHVGHALAFRNRVPEIGRASGRERVGQYV